MKHLDLFSGIGGFAYAADQVAIEIMKAIYEQTRTAPVEDKTIF
jgi:site-specific DNA-cytosine methylase